MDAFIVDVVFDAPEDRPAAWDKLVGVPASFDLIGHFQPCPCDDCKMAVAELYDRTVGYRE